MLHVTVKQAQAALICREVDSHLGKCADQCDILNKPRDRHSGHAGQLEAVAMQVKRVHVIGRVAHFQTVAPAVFQMESRLHLVH